MFLYISSMFTCKLFSSNGCCFLSLFASICSSLKWLIFQFVFSCIVCLDEFCFCWLLMFLRKLNVKYEACWHALLLHGVRFDGTTDAVGIQFFLQNVHPEIKTAASTIFGSLGTLHARPNTFGELMRVIISPSQIVQKAVQWASKGFSPDIVLHMRMMANRYDTLYVA